MNGKRITIVLALILALAATAPYAGPEGSSPDDPSTTGDPGETDSAQDPGTTHPALNGGPPSRGLALGLGVIRIDQPYSGSDPQVFIVPLAHFQYRRFFADGLDIGLRLAQREHLRLDAIARPGPVGYDADDSPTLDGMEDRDLSANAGLRLTWSSSHLEASLGLTTDILGRNEGQRAELEAKRTFRIGRWGRITPSLRTTWLSDEVVDYYYGVRPQEARPERPIYDGRSTINVRLGLSGLHPLSRRWVVRATVAAERHGDEIRQSPLVDRSTTTGFSIGVLRRF